MTANADRAPDERECGDRGPRIGDTVYRCIRPRGHDGSHEGHDAVTWPQWFTADEKASSAADRARAEVQAAVLDLLTEWETRAEAFKGTGVGDAYANVVTFTRSRLGDTTALDRMLAEARAEALRDAADALSKDDHVEWSGWEWHIPIPQIVAGWLRGRAEDLAGPVTKKEAP